MSIIFRYGGCYVYVVDRSETRKHIIDFLAKKWMDIYEEIGYRKIYRTIKVDINNLLKIVCLQGERNVVNKVKVR